MKKRVCAVTLHTLEDIQRAIGEEPDTRWAREVVFEDVLFQRVYFHGFLFIRARFVRCRFEACVFTEQTRLSLTQLIDCTLDDCVLNEAEVSRVVFDRVRLARCRVRGVLFKECLLHQTRIDDGRIEDTRILRSVFISQPEAWLEPAVIDPENWTEAFQQTLSTRAVPRWVWLWRALFHRRLPWTFPDAPQTPADERFLRPSGRFFEGESGTVVREAGRVVWTDEVMGSTLRATAQLTEGRRQVGITWADDPATST